MSRNKDAIIGQYISDYSVHAGDPSLHIDPMGVKTMRGDGNAAMHHPDTLFDHEGDWDPATGRKQQMPGLQEQMYTSGEEIRIVDDRHLDLGASAGRGALSIDGDPADEWMKQHGFKW